MVGTIFPVAGNWSVTVDRTSERDRTRLPSLATAPERERGLVALLGAEHRPSDRAEQESTRGERVGSRVRGGRANWCGNVANWALLGCERCLHREPTGRTAVGIGVVAMKTWKKTS